jgi:probable rRNA maturation factor
MISFNNADVKFTLKNRSLIKKWITTVVVKNKRKVGDIGFVFCSDEHLLTINKQYLDHDTYTDIITFDYSKESKTQAISGEIFISVERVEENAKKFGKTVENELHRVMIHGVLHLLGHGDKSKKAKEEMRRQEDLCLKAFPKK